MEAHDSLKELPNYKAKSTLQRVARKIASEYTDTHAEWMKAMPIALKALEFDVTPEVLSGLQGLYDDSGSGRIHRLKVISGQSQADANNAAKDAYTHEGVPADASALRKLASGMSAGLTGGDSIKQSIHGLSSLGAVAGQGLAALLSGGASIPAALVGQALAGGVGNSVGGVAADFAGQQLTNYMVGRDASIKGADVEKARAAGLSPKEASPSYGSAVAPAKAEYSPGSDFVAGGLGTLAGAGIAAAGGGIKAGVPAFARAYKGVPGAVESVNPEIATGARQGLKGFLGIDGPKINPQDQAALRVLAPEERNQLFTGYGGEPGTSAMVVHPEVNTELTRGPRNTGLGGIKQLQGQFDKASGDLTESAVNRVVAEKESQAATNRLNDLRAAADHQQKLLDKLRGHSSALEQEAPEHLANLQDATDTHAATMRARTRLGDREQTAAEKAFALGREQDLRRGQVDRVAQEGVKLDAEAPAHAAKLQAIKEGGAGEVASRKKAESAMEKWLGLGEERDARMGQLSDLAQREGAVTEAAPLEQAVLQEQKNALAAGTRESKPFALDETTPEGRAIANIMRRATVEPEDPTMVGNMTMGNWPPVSRADAALRSERSTAQPGNSQMERWLSQAGGDPTAIPAENAISMVAEMGKKANVATVPPPVTYAEVPRTPAQANAAGLSPKAKDMAQPEMQAVVQKQKQRAGDMQTVQARAGRAAEGVDELGVKQEIAAKQAERLGQEASEWEPSSLRSHEVQRDRLQAERGLENLRETRARFNRGNDELSKLQVQKQLAKEGAKRAAAARAQAQQAPSLSDVDLSRKKFQKEQALDNLRRVQRQIQQAEDELNRTFEQEAVATGQEARAKQAAQEAAKAGDPQATMEAQNILNKKRLALQQFLPPQSGMRETPELPGTGFVHAQPRFLAELFKGRAFPTSRLGGLRAESPEQTAMQATGRLFDTDRFSGGPAKPPLYGPPKPVSDIFSNPPTSVADQDAGTIARLFDQYLTEGREPKP